MGLMLLFVFSTALAGDDKPKAEGDKKADTTKMADMKKDASTVSKKPTEKSGKESKVPEWTVTESGLKYRDIVVGKGSVAKMGDSARCHYTVWLATPEGEKGKFVQTSKEGDPYSCKIGYKLIKGWSEGMLGMKEGGTRELLVPPFLGYGDRAMGNMIPANSMLYFEIEFVNEIKH